MAARIAFFERQKVHYVTCPEWDEVAGYSGNRRLSQHHSQAQLAPSETAASLAQALEMAEKVSIYINIYVSYERCSVPCFPAAHLSHS